MKWTLGEIEGTVLLDAMVNKYYRTSSENCSKTYNTYLY